MSNGWKAFNKNVLKRRFGAQKSHTIYGQKTKLSSGLIDSELLANDSGFVEMLKYINTEPNKQRKGKSGSVK